MKAWFIHCWMVCTSWFFRLTFHRSPTRTATIIDLILEANSSYTTYYNGQIDSVVHAILRPTAQAIAQALLVQAKRYPALPLPYMLACLCQESRFDPCCYSRNLKEHHGSASFEGTDWGIAQLSGRIISQVFPLKSSIQLQTMACSIEEAIPYFATLMDFHLEWAREVVQSTETAAQILAIKEPYRDEADPELVYWLATLAYNRGRSGALAMIRGQAPLVTHARSVQTFAKTFSFELTL